MKTKITQWTMALALNALAFGAVAQITINKSDYPRGTAFIGHFTVATQTGITLPTEGPAQIWDFATGITADSIHSPQYLDASADPDFPSALNRRDFSILFQGFLIPNERYEAIDANGWYRYGYKLGAADYSLATITGNANDSLHFLAKNDIYAGRADLLQFPLDYQDSWVNSHIETIDFELTVSGSVPPRTPGNRQRMVTLDREVVGHGTLRIPRADGSPSQPFDVLLIKSIKTEVDSFFVNGSPASSQLLGAFGLIQGETIVYESYIFYRKDFGFPVMGMSIVNGQVGRLDYRSDAATVSLDEFSSLNAKTFPNPVAAGGLLQIEMGNAEHGTGDFEVLDITGRTVYRAANQDFSDGIFRHSLPEDLARGSYFFKIINGKGQSLAAGKLAVD